MVAGAADRRYRRRVAEPDDLTRVLDALDAGRLAADLTRLVRVPSVTGDERAAVELVVQLAREHGLAGEVVEHDLAALRAHPDHPGAEVPRTELLHADVVLRGRGGPRLCLSGHVDVVPVGTGAWRHGPWSATVEEGELHGRGSADMKAAVVAALHAMAALRAAGVSPPGDVVLQAVTSEEDGGQGAFAALERDADFAAALVLEPTGFELVCAQAGALTFSGVVTGKAAHAARRLNGVSALDRYVPLHLAFAEHERALNTAVEHPLMAHHALPYPLLVGRLQVGEWSSQVPDRLVFEGRLGVRVGEDVAAARAALQAVVDATLDGVQLTWTGGQYASAQTPVEEPWVARVREAAREERGVVPPVAGVTWGADMRLYAARGIPTIMFGTHGIELAHAVDERVSLAEVMQLARVLVRTLAASG